MAEPQDNTTPTPSAPDTTPKVTGIGGIFFFSDNPKATNDWYARNLGLPTTDWGATFEARDADRPEQVTQLQWSAFQTGSDYFAPSQREFMINYRVQHLEALVARLRENGVTILDDIASHDYGKFVHILDADGRKLELWEPA